MAQIITVLPQVVVSAGTANEEVTINEAVINRIENPILKLTVISGTFKFAVGQDADNSDATYSAGDTCTVTIRQTDRFRSDPKNLNFSNAASGSEFKIEAI